MGKVFMPGGGGNFDDILPIEKGGTGAGTAREAYKKLSLTVVTASGEDLDNYTAPGVYHFNANITPTNIPAGVNGWLVVMTDGGNTVKQIWFRQGTANSNDFDTFTRIKLSTGWGNWVKFATAKELNRTNAVQSANTAYTTYMARGIALVTAAPTSMVNGACAFVYK